MCWCHLCVVTDGHVHVVLAGLEQECKPLRGKLPVVCYGHGCIGGRCGNSFGDKMLWGWGWRWRGGGGGGLRFCCLSALSQTQFLFSNYNLRGAISPGSCPPFLAYAACTTASISLLVGPKTWTLAGHFGGLGSAAATNKIVAVNYMCFIFLLGLNFVDTV